MRSREFLMHDALIYTLGGLCALIANYANAAPAHDVVSSSDRKTVIDSNGHCVRTKWMVAGDPCAPPQVVTQQTTYVEAPHWSKEERTLYFGFNSATLDQTDKDKINTIAGGIKNSPDVKAAHVVGYADRIGSTSYNEELSKRRANAVQQYMIQQGVVQPSNVETRWLGKQESSRANCPDSLSHSALIQCLQPDRRVEIEIDYLKHSDAKE